MTRRCPDCGEQLGGRYKHQGRLVCWPCTGLEALPAAPVRDPDWRRFRRHIIDAIAASGFHYVDQNTIVGACPACLAGNIRVEFHGLAPRATITCSLGCDDEEIGRTFALEVES
jgi:hypothetical protein